jgi:sugar lactone lactonase YvrE
MSSHPRVTRAVILLSLLAAALPAQQGFITTVAGTGVAGTSGTGGPAANAQLAAPSGICIDQSLNVYIADTLNNRVVKVNGNTGILTLAAGNGAAASTGDGGPAVLASLNNPRGVAVDTAGNLFVVEFQGHRVRRIDAATGIITTVVGTGAAGFSGDGGPAVNAAIAFAFSIAMGPRGNLFIADSGNARVRRVDAVTGIITTVAGNGTMTPSPDGTLAVNAGLGAPIAVSVDISDTMLISEYTNARIRYVDPSTGMLSTFAGNGSTVFTGDGVPATSAGIGNVAFNVITDGRGNIYFPDGTGRIRRVDSATRTIVTVAGNGSGAQGVTTSSAGGGSGCIATVLGDNGPAASATLDGPYAVAYANNVLLITDALDCRIRRVFLPSPNPYTNTTLSASSPSINQGDPVTFTAAVTSIPLGGSPTGSVQFIDQPQGFGPTVLGTATLSGGSASLTVTSLLSGSPHLIGAYYMGDPLFNGSGSAGVAVAVGPPVAKPSPIISMSAPVYATLNLPTSISVTVSTPYGSTAQPTGSVVLYDAAVAIQTASLVNGVAQFSVAFTALGSHSIAAAYQGDSNYGPVTTSASVTVKNASSVALSSAPNPSTQGTAVTFTATMTPSTATGYVELHWDTNLMCIGNIANGVASCSVSWLPAGAHSIQGFYNGDSALMGSTSNILTQTVKATTTTTVTSSAAPSTYGQPVTFTATVSPASATGVIQFTDGATSLGSAPLSGGSAAITVSTLNGGVHAITAIYSGDANNAAGTSAVFSQTVQPATLTITLACSPNPSLVNQAVACSATLSSTTATGTMQFLDGTTAIITGPLNSGVGSMSVLSLTAGSHSITAAYSGDANYAGITSAPVTQIVKAATATTIASDTQSPAYGQAINLIATVTPVPAGGTVQFQEGITVLGTANLGGGGIATLPIATLAVGAHTIVAAYSGDANDERSASAPMTLTVVKANTTVALASSLNPGTVGQAVTFTTTISPAAATGSVQFLDGTIVLGTAAVSGGSAAVTTSSLGAGSHSIVAVYSGDAMYAGGTSAALSQSVNKVATTVVPGSTLNPSTFTQAVGLTALVTPGSATGTVQFFDGSTLLGTATLSGGAGSITISTLAPGNHSITAVYSGDASSLGSTSPVLSQTVNKAPSAVTVVSSPNPAGVGSAITFTASLTHTLSSATGSVQFLDGSTVLGTVPLTSGSAALTTSSLAAGSHTITAVYSGDANFTGSSASRSQSVWNPTSTSLTSDKTFTTYGQTITFTASVSPSTATGTILFSEGAVFLASVPMSGGKATFAIATLSAGTHTINATYSGDAADGPSPSGIRTVTVAQVKPAIAVTASPDPAQVGQTVTLTATISSSAATGTVAFKDGTQTIGAATLSNGVAVFSTSSLPAGNHSITAVYSGDINYISVTSSKDILKVK